MTSGTKVEGVSDIGRIVEATQSTTPTPFIATPTPFIFRLPQRTRAKEIIGISDIDRIVAFTKSLAFTPLFRGALDWRERLFRVDRIVDVWSAMSGGEFWERN